MRLLSFELQGLHWRLDYPDTPCAQTQHNLAQECARLWQPYQTQPSQASAASPHFTIQLHDQPWPPPNRPSPQHAQIFFDSLRWTASDGQFVLDDGHSVITGNRGEIHVHLNPHSRVDARAFVHFNLNLAFVETLRHHGLFYVHGAAVQSTGGRRYLIAGDGGRGKSTLTISLLAEGYRYLSDDAVFLDTREASIRIIGYEKSFHVGNDLLPRLLSRVTMPHFVPYGQTAKSEADPRLCFPGQGLNAFERVDIILIPSIQATEHTRVKPLSPAQVLMHLFTASTQVFFEPALAARHLSALKHVASQARGFAFQAGRDVYDNPSLYHSLLESL